MSDNKQELINMLLENCNTLAQKERQCEMLGVSFEWPSIDSQVIGNGKIARIKRGRASHDREMFQIPGFEVKGHAPFAGFVCYPEAALASAAELIRLAKEYMEKQK